MCCIFGGKIKKNDFCCFFKKRDVQYIVFRASKRWSNNDKLQTPNEILLQPQSTAVYIVELLQKHYLNEGNYVPTSMRKEK